MSQSRQLAVIMFTDIAGYTGIMHRDEHQAVAVIQHYHAALDTWIPHFHGQVINDYGDGSLCIFSRATDAAHCAVAIQQALQEAPVVPLRIGLHIGEKILSAIQEIYEGGSPMTPTIASRVLKRVKNQRVTDSENTFNLTDRGKQILSFLVEGMSYKMNAEAYVISIDTVNLHIKNMYKKLQVHSKSEAVAKAIKGKMSNAQMVNRGKDATYIP